MPSSGNLPTVGGTLVLLEGLQDGCLELGAFLEVDAVGDDHPFGVDKEEGRVHTHRAVGFERLWGRVEQWKRDPLLFGIGRTLLIVRVKLEHAIRVDCEDLEATGRILLVERHQDRCRPDAGGR